MAMVEGFGTTGGALFGGHPHRSHNEKRVWNDMWSPAQQTNKRGYGFTRVAHADPRSRSETAASHVYPDPPSRGEKWGLEREERCVVREMKRSGAIRPLTRVVYPETRSRSEKGVWNDMGSPAWWPPPNENRGSGTT